MESGCTKCFCKHHRAMRATCNHKIPFTCHSMLLIATKDDCTDGGRAAIGEKCFIEDDVVGRHGVIPQRVAVNLGDGGSRAVCGLSLFTQYCGILLLLGMHGSIPLVILLLSAIFFTYHIFAAVITLDGISAMVVLLRLRE
jgi:hypothetical protein